jgi:hypothetical protein
MAKRFKQKEPWEVARDEALKKKAFKAKYPHVGKKVRRKDRSKWEYGVMDIFNLGLRDEYCIAFDDNSREQLIGLPFQVEINGKWHDGFDSLDNLIVNYE